MSKVASETAGRATGNERQSGAPLTGAEHALLDACGLVKSYRLGKRSLEVLRRVDLAVARGDFLAVRGASGAGKSTLLHLLGGLDAPTAGEIRFDGKNLAGLSGLELARFRNRR